MPHAFRFLDDIALADIAFEAIGDSVEEVFRGATQALLETLADPTTVGRAWKHHVHKTEERLDELLIDWLSEIVYWKDAAGVVFHEASLTVSREPDRWTLHAKLVGAPVDPQTQVLRNDVKGVTKHLYELEQSGTQWKSRVVLDV